MWRGRVCWLLLLLLLLIDFKLLLLNVELTERPEEVCLLFDDVSLLMIPTWIRRSPLLYAVPLLPGFVRIIPASSFSIFSQFMAFNYSQ
jgi:hypothetical protein